MFATEDGTTELAQDGGGGVAEGLGKDGLQLVGVVERQAGDGQFGQQVVLADFAPFVVAVVVERAVEAGVVSVGRHMVLVARLGVAPQAAVGHQVDIAAHHHHRDAIVFVFLDDVVADFLGVVATVHGSVDVLQGRHADAQATTRVKCHIISKIACILRRRDEQDFVSGQLAVATGVTFHHLGVLCEAKDAVLRLGPEPELAAVVGARGLIFNGNRHRLGIADLAQGGFVFHGREATEGKRNAVEHLRADGVEFLVRISLVGTIKRLVFLEGDGAVVGDGTRLLGGHKVVVSFQLREVAQSHADGGGFGVLRQHQADALPRQ